MRIRTEPTGGAVCRGFARVEALAIIVIVLLVSAVLVPTLERSRHLGRLGDDMAKLRRYGVATGAYGADNADQYWAFSWKKGIAYCPFPELNNAPSDLQAAANQAVFILRTRAGRLDMPVINAWIPHVFYVHLVLAEYEDRPLPDLDAISSEDKHRLLWARDPHGFDQCLYVPNPGCGTPTSKRWPYGASWQMPAAFYDGSAVGARLTQGSVHNQFLIPGTASLQGQAVSSTAFPAQKVLLHDAGARHYGPRSGYCTHDEARSPLLFADGSVRVHGAADANPGWQPNMPTSASPTAFLYGPAPWEPPTYSGLPTETVIGRFRWTRGGLLGRDFGGPEVCTGQPGCR